MTATELLPCLLDWFIYEPDTGVLRWKRKPRKGIQIGDVIGTPDSNGRLRFEFRGKTYPVHLVAFAIYYERWPKAQVDHKNCIKTDNRIENLTLMTWSEHARHHHR